MRTMRTDIQVLRAIAVLSVLIFHFELPGLHKGFLGVDIFFVISGYLMSRVIIDEMDQGRFSPAVFYFRRARRLLPAALAMFIGVTALAPWALTVSALHDYVAQLLGALGFMANIVLWQQSGYFDGQATLKPLLHTWSLALEEQYYFVLPLVLAWIGPRWRGAGLLALLLASLAACQWWLTADPAGAFYLLPTRAWELLIGSLCALPSARRLGLVRLRVDSGWWCLPVMGLSLVWGLDDTHPRWDALLVCLSTAGLILMPSRLLQSQRGWMRPWHWVGDQSYSLYLVHWPLMALAKNIWLQGVPHSVSLLLLLLSFGLAYLSYTFIEQPFRQVATPGQLVRRLAWMLLALAVAGGLLWQQLEAARAQNWAQRRLPNYGFAATCDAEFAFDAKPACANAPQPRTMVWGDSFAMHLIPAVTASGLPGGVMQATRSSCAPLLNHARQMPSDPPQRGVQCLAFNRSVLAYLRAHRHVERVVLSARWQYLFDDPVVDAKGHLVHPASADLARDLIDTIEALRAMGKRVFIVSPPASLGPGLDLGLCAERRVQGLLTIMDGVDADCTFAQAAQPRQQAQVTALLHEVGARADVRVIWLDGFNCQAGRCAALLGQTPIYRDFGHLSREGATLLGRQRPWRQLLETGAH